MLSATVLMIASLTAGEAAEPPPAAASATARAVQTGELVKMIAREAIELQKLEAVPERPEATGAFSAHPSHDKYADFAVRFAEARTPACLGPDGLKFNPPHIGPIGLGGLLAIPWVVGAKLKGKCN
jgi:hypothetical protein